jgi:hypothetical protein
MGTVISIGKLGAGQADYYLEQAQGRLTLTASVAGGVEDYYVGGHEAAGHWRRRQPPAWDSGRGRS